MLWSAPRLLSGYDSLGKVKTIGSSSEELSRESIEYTSKPSDKKLSWRKLKPLPVISASSSRESIRKTGR
jgi:hypothetical protein